jgi:hypothetical protein
MPYNLTIDDNGLESGIVSSSYFTSNIQSLYDQQFLEGENYFGTSENDIVEFSVYDSDQEILQFNRIVPTSNFSIVSGRYVDVDGNAQTYNFPKTSTNYVKTDDHVLLDVQDQFTSTDLSPGLYYGLYNFVRDIAGTPSHRLVIKDISPSRSELRFTIGFNADETSESDLTYNRISAFSQKKFLFLQLRDQIDNVIAVNPVEENFNSSINSTKAAVAHNLGFSNESQLQEFINTTYTGFDKVIKYFKEGSEETLIEEINKFIGIREQLNNFTFTFNDTPLSREEILNSFRTITTKVSQDRILQRTTLDDDRLDEAVALFVDVIYNEWLIDQLGTIMDDYTQRFFGLYKNVINFGNGTYVQIIDHTSYVNPTTNQINLQVKLDSPLPTSFNLKDVCWITNVSISPLYFKVNLFTKNVSQKVFLNGVNFDVNPTVDVTRGTTEGFVAEESNTIDKSKSKLKDKINDLVIDYTDFNNFVNYSSAEIRTKIAKNKIAEFNALESSKTAIDTAVATATLSVSASLSVDQTAHVGSQISLLDTFDDYESYLFFNQSLDVDDMILDGVEYDRQNGDSLISQLPEYIQNDEESAEYLLFSSMIGHFFDNILLYIKKFPKTYPLSDSNDQSFPKNYIDELLNSFNWKTTNFLVQNSNATQYAFNQSENSSSLTSSYFDYGKEVLNRFATNLPAIYKSKGTTPSFELVRSIFGIDSSLIQVKEYSSFDTFVNNDQYYEFDDITYLTRIDGNKYITFDVEESEYKFVAQTPYSSSAGHLPTGSLIETYTGISAVEASFKFKKSDYEYLERIPILKKERNGVQDWQVYLQKERQAVSGKLIFELTPPEAGITSSIISDELPFFNGNLYTCIINREVVSGYTFDASTETSSSHSGGLYFTSSNADKFVPHEYTLDVNQFDGSFRNFASKSTKRILYSQNQHFSSGSYYVGNHRSSSYFEGNIDKVKLFKIPVTTPEFTEHCYNIDSISTSDKSNLYANVPFVWSFYTPVELWNSGSGTFNVIENQNGAYTSSFKAYNFESDITSPYPDCVPINTTKFPYQFEEVRLKQAVNISKYGPNYKNNVKINKLDEFADSNLVPYDNSTTTNDIVGEDSNVVGFYISPYSFLEKNIEDFLGSDGVISDIGDPKFINDSTFPTLVDKRKEFASLNQRLIYPQESYSTYKFYIDFSIFDQIKQLLPARASLKRGLLLEPSLLEKQRFKFATLNVDNDNELSQSSITFDLSMSPSQSLYDLSGTTTDIDITYINNHREETDSVRHNTFQIGDVIDDRDFIYTRYGKTTSVDELGFHIREVYNKPIDEFYLTRNNSGTSIMFTSSYTRIEEIGSGSLTGSSQFTDTYYGELSSGYSRRHLSKLDLVGSNQKYNALRFNHEITQSFRYMRLNTKVSQSYTYIKGENSSDTTINRSGVANNSEPVITIGGYLNMELSASTFPAHGSVNSANEFVQTALTASISNSSSLDRLIYNL